MCQQIKHDWIVGGANVLPYNLTTNQRAMGGAKCVQKLNQNMIKTRSSAIAEGPRDASCQLKSCQLPRNSAKTICTTNPEQIEVM